MGGGFFKCCVSTLSLNVFDETRKKVETVGANRMIDKTQKWKQKRTYCSCIEKNDPWCKKWILKKKDPCNVCTADAVCTTRDSVTNKTVHILQSATTKGNIMVKGLKTILIS